MTVAGDEKKSNRSTRPYPPFSSARRTLAMLPCTVKLSKLSTTTLCFTTCLHSLALFPGTRLMNRCRLVKAKPLHTKSDLTQSYPVYSHPTNMCGVRHLKSSAEPLPKSTSWTTCANPTSYRRSSTSDIYGHLREFARTAE